MIKAMEYPDMTTFYPQSNTPVWRLDSWMWHKELFLIIPDIHLSLGRYLPKTTSTTKVDVKKNVPLNVNLSYSIDQF